MNKLILLILLIILVGAWSNSITTNIALVSSPDQNGTLDIDSRDMNKTEVLGDTTSPIEENIKTAPYSLYQNLTNGQIWSNGSHYTANITTQEQRLPTLDYYNLTNIDTNNWYLQTVYGHWLLSKTDGCILLYDNLTKIYTSEEWYGIYNGNKVNPQTESINVIERNSDNLTIRLIKSYAGNSYLAIDYAWIQGYLKITTYIQAGVSGNFRVAIRITGLDEFTTADLIHLNKSRFVLNFADMQSKIDFGQSSFTDGNLLLVSKSVSLTTGQRLVVDPSVYTTIDANDFHLYKLTGGTYLLETGGTTLLVGNASATNNVPRSFLRFPLAFIGKYSTISSSAVYLKMMSVDESASSTNISLLGWDITKSPYTESTAVANSTVFDGSLQGGSNYNVTLRLGAQAAPAVGQLYYWTVTNFVQEWITGRTVDNIGWLIRQLYDTGVGAVYDRCRFYEAQYGSNQPYLSITWTTDTLPPAISSNQSTAWTNQNSFLITAYDQPTGTASGLNLTTLAYSLNIGTWTPAPISYTNTGIRYYYTVSGLMSEGSQTIAFRICDLAGNWGYSNSSFGKQYYPKYSNTYAYQNTTESIGWGEEWTESTTGWTATNTISSTVSAVTGYYNNAIQFAVYDTNLWSADYDPANFDISPYSLFNYRVKSNVSDSLISYVQILNAWNGSAYPELNYAPDVLVTTNWKSISLSLSDFTRSVTFNPAVIDRIIFGIISSSSQRVLLSLDGLHFENLGGDSATESVTTGIGGTWSWYGGSSYGTPTTSTTKTRGYESIKFTTNSTYKFSDGNMAPKLTFSSSINLSEYDYFTVSLYPNTTTTKLWYVGLHSDGSNYARYFPPPSTVASPSYPLTANTWNVITWPISYFLTGTLGGSFNLSSVSYIHFRVYDSAAAGYCLFDALNFYASNQSVYFDQTHPTITLDSTTEQASNSPWDHLYCVNRSFCYFSNDQTMNTSLTAAVTIADALSGVATLNSSAFGSDQNQSALAGSYDLTYYINSGENDNITITVYDQAGNSAAVTITMSVDNTAPTGFAITSNFTVFYTPCILCTLAEAIDSDAGVNGYTITVQVNNMGKWANYTTAGIKQTCGLFPGTYYIDGQVWDNVGNLALASTNDNLLVQVTYNEQTGVYHGAEWNPAGAIIQAAEPLALLLGLIVGIILILRLIPSTVKPRGGRL